MIKRADGTAATKAERPAYIPEFDPVTVTRSGWRVTLRWDGEGIWGRYSHAHDDDDRQVLRLVVENTRNAESFSTSTYLLASDSRDDIEQAADLVARRCVANARRPDPFFARKVSYLHLGAKGPSLDIPSESRCDEDD